MKKISKIVGILSAALLLGSIVGCTTSIESPKLDVGDPIVTDKGAIFNIGVRPEYEQYTTITRQEGKDGIEEKVDTTSEQVWMDYVKEGNILKQGVEYIYRFYNSNAASSVSSCVEKKVKFDKIAAKGTKLDPWTANDIKEVYYDNGVQVKNAYKSLGIIKYVIDGIEGNRSLSAGTHTVALYRTWPNNYYEESDPYEVEVTVEKGSATVDGFKIIQRNGDLVLKWYCKDSDTFTVERRGNDTDWNWKALDVEVTSGTDYKGKTYYTATDSTVVIGGSYNYRIVTDNNAFEYKDNNGIIYFRVSSKGAWRVNANADKDEVTLTWSMDDEKESLKPISIYKADITDFIGYNVDIDYDYDLFVKTEIKPVYDERTGKYKAVDSKVPVGKYAYMLVIDNFSKTSNVVTVTIAEQAKRNTVKVESAKTINSDSVKKDTIISWEGFADTTKYKLSYVTIDNKGKESEEKELAAEITSDGYDHYRAVIKAGSFGTSKLDLFGTSKLDFTKVKIYVNAYDGETLVYPDDIWDNTLRKNVPYPNTCTLDIDPELTNYAYVDGAIVEKNSEKTEEVIVTFTGYNLADAKVYYWDIREYDVKYGSQIDNNTQIIPVTVTKEKPNEDETWETYTGKVTFPAGTNGDYKFVVIIPKDTAYDNTVETNCCYNNPDDQDDPFNGKDFIRVSVPKAE